jgi:hypothetical protein
MLSPAFITQIQQRFSHEKRARVCLWFDPGAEFARLVPVLQQHLDGMNNPPFRLLTFDAKAKHGQLWLKRQTWEGQPGKFVLHLPFPEERMTSPDERGKNHLELLTEFTITGVDWKVGGKRPTLFSFLKAAGVRLPDAPAEQRKLTEGGADSLLSKYAARFHDKSAVFWEETVTPALVLSRIVGDVDQVVLDLAAQPDEKWEEMKISGGLAQFLDAAKERFGDPPATDHPVLWVKALVERLALAECFVGYGEPADFPFADRVPPVRYRDNHITLVRRWLRDTNSRGAWDRYVAEVEEHVNLKAWARGRHGSCYGLPHLVSLRWETAISGLAEAARDGDDLSNRCREDAAVWRTEAEYSRASSDVTPWSTLLEMAGFMEDCTKATKVAHSVVSTVECVHAFRDFALAVDGQHLRLKAALAELEMPDVCQAIDKAYGDYTKTLNQHFFEAWTDQPELDIPGLQAVTTRLDAVLWAGKGKRAVVIVDALRYDLALRLQEMLKGFTTEVESMRAALPTITPIGMSALLPGSYAPDKLNITGNSLHPTRQGVDLAVRQNRLALLKEFGADCREIDTIESAASKPSKLPTLLVVFGHEEVDAIGHGNGDALARHVEKELERLVRITRKLHQWGYAEVHLVTDHGFVLLDESHLPNEVPVNKEWCLALKERFAIVPAKADLPLKTKPFLWDADVRVAIPPGMAFFKAEKSFSHGGATLQELVIPHLISRSRAKQQRVGVEILLGGTGAQLKSAAVKVVLRPMVDSPEGELANVAAQPRNLEIDVTHGKDRKSILPRGERKPVKLESSGEKAVTLFFDSKFALSEGDQVHLEVRDTDTGEQFPGPGGITLQVSRNL